MMGCFPVKKHYTYKKNTIKTVICQLRFPPILNIDNKPPADFQDAIRQDFPGYSEQSEFQHEFVIGLNAVQPIQPIQPLSNVSLSKNYIFESKDKMWSVALTRNFIAFSTKKYTTWNAFWRKFNKAYESFLELYSISSFSRIGLRYINSFCRTNLALSPNTPWKELLNPQLIGLLGTEEAHLVESFSNTMDLKFPSQNYNGRLTIKLVKSSDPTKKMEPVFVIDDDIFINKATLPENVKKHLDLFHSEAHGIIECILTEKMRKILGIKNEK